MSKYTSQFTPVRRICHKDIDVDVINGVAQEVAANLTNEELDLLAQIKHFDIRKLQSPADYPDRKVRGNLYRVWYVRLELQRRQLEEAVLLELRRMHDIGKARRFEEIITTPLPLRGTNERRRIALYSMLCSLSKTDIKRQRRGAKPEKQTARVFGERLVPRLN